MKMVRGLVFLIFLTVACSSFAKPKPRYDTLFYKNIELEIQKKFVEIRNNTSYEFRMNLSRQIESVFDTLLIRKDSFLYPFDSLSDLISNLYSDDKLLRIINWNIPKPDATYHYFGYVQYFDKKNDTLLFWKLFDNGRTIAYPEETTLSPDNWYGALYYEIIPTKISKHQRVYVLLGYEGYNLYARRKLIDVLYINNENLFFGKELFSFPSGKKKRIIFTYNYRANMKLRWDFDYQMIVFQHLERVPTLPTSLEGNMAPSVIFDGLKWNGKEWIFQENVNVVNLPKKKTSKRKKYPY